MRQQPLLELDPAELDRLEGVALAATDGPWDIERTDHPHHRGGHHTELRIRTSWIHGQLKGHYPVITTSVGIGKTAGGPGTHMVAMRADDANFIASFNPSVALQLLGLAKRALLPALPAPTIWRIVTGHGTHYRDTPPPPDAAHLWEAYAMVKPSSPLDPSPVSTNQGPINERPI